MDTTFLIQYYHVYKKNFNFQIQESLAMSSNGKILDWRNFISPYVCYLCSQCFDDEDTYFSHVLDSHSIDIKSAVAHEEEVATSSTPIEKPPGKATIKRRKPKNLSDITIHHSADAVQCDKCSFMATIPASFDLHEVVHMSRNEIMYKCRECSYGTDRKCSFNSHILSHYNDNPYVCHLCGKGFKDKRPARRHIRISHW